jgi:hypothetical protein
LYFHETAATINQFLEALDKSRRGRAINNIVIKADRQA